MRISRTNLSLAVFFVAFLYVIWTSGARFVLNNNDEGIYLSTAQRMLEGEVPYRDFFLYIGPGTPAIIAASLRIFGDKLWTARIPVAIDLAVMTACLFWLIERFASRPIAVLSAFCFLAFETADHTLVLANHRWDSSAAATAAIAVTVSLIDNPSGLRSALAGALAALAGWMTTPVGIVAIVIVIAALAIKRLRPMLPSIIAGGLACSAAFIAWLAAHGALSAAINAMLWPASHYSGANRTSYGWVIGGYANLFRDTSAAETGVTIFLLLFLTLPATLPILAAAGWPVRLKIRAQEPAAALWLVLAAMIALVISTLPRPDLIHLMYVSPLAYVLGAALAARLLPKGPGIMVAVIFLVMASTDYGIAIRRRLSDPWLETRVGLVHGSSKDLAVLQFVNSSVRPEDRLFVFPYWPIFYFTSGAHNPTRYTYLQPGMFSLSDEQEALRELETSPPSRLLYLDIPPESYLRIWPGSDASRLRLTNIEEFIATRYHSLARHEGFDLRAPNP